MTDLDLDKQLWQALASAGAALEAMPHDERHERVHNFLLEQGWISPETPRSAEMFLVGVFISEHDRRIIGVSDD